MGVESEALGLIVVVVVEEALRAGVVVDTVVPRVVQAINRSVVVACVLAEAGKVLGVHA